MRSEGCLGRFSVPGGVASERLLGPSCAVCVACPWALSAQEWSECTPNDSEGAREPFLDELGPFLRSRFFRPPGTGCGWDAREGCAPGQRWKSRKKTLRIKKEQLKEKKKIFLKKKKRLFFFGLQRLRISSACEGLWLAIRRFGAHAHMWIQALRGRNKAAATWGGPGEVTSEGLGVGRVRGGSPPPPAESAEKPEKPEIPPPKLITLRLRGRVVLSRAMSSKIAEKMSANRPFLITEPKFSSEGENEKREIIFFQRMSCVNMRTLAFGSLQRLWKAEWGAVG